MENYSFIQKNLFESLFFAQEVARKLNTRVANFHDLVNLRINQDPSNSLAWNRWYTPFATIYLGRRDGRRLIAVAQHLGPLGNRERFEQWAESGERDDDSGNRHKYGSAGLPKISQQEFADLLDGKYGEVDTLDFEEYYAKYGTHIQMSQIDFLKAGEDPLLKLLFGDQSAAFLQKHFQISRDYAKEKNKESGAENKILEIGIRDRYGWPLFGSQKVDFPDNEPVALFLTLNRAACYSNHDLSVATEIRTMEDAGMANFVVLGDEKKDVTPVSYSQEKHWINCLVDNEEEVPDFFVLMEMGEKLFSQYPKEGEQMDSGQPMFEVLEYEKIGDATSFKTKLNGSCYLLYDIQEAIAVAPEGANAYIIDGEIAGGQIATVPVQFFKVKVNSQKRILRSQEVASALALLLKINRIELP